MLSSTQIRLGVVPRDEQVAALWLLFAVEPEPVRRDRVAASVHAALQGTVDFELLLEARRDGRRVGVVWGQKLAGRNANVWPPSLESGESEETADLLQFELDKRLSEIGLAMGQALLPVTAADAARCLRRNGYRQAANLLYLFSTSQQFPSEALDGSSLQFESFRENESGRLAHVIERTYIDSRDAPELDGLRSIEDVIEGYKMTGQFSPERWFFVRREGVDVGCLLLTDHPTLRHWELIYMGLIPSARRKGWGSELVRFAQWQARCAMCEVLLVSVDAANEPAVAAYARCGFSELDRREVWVKKFGDRS